VDNIYRLNGFLDSREQICFLLDQSRSHPRSQMEQLLPSALANV
jgi:hypothetical protein